MWRFRSLLFPRRWLSFSSSFWTDCSCVQPTMVASSKVSDSMTISVVTWYHLLIGHKLYPQWSHDHLSGHKLYPQWSHDHLSGHKLYPQWSHDHLSGNKLYPQGSHDHLSGNKLYPQGSHDHLSGNKLYPQGSHDHLFSSHTTVAIVVTTYRRLKDLSI